MRSAINIINACEDTALFAGWFRDRSTWSAWFAFAKALFALTLDETELEIFRKCTGRDQPSPAGYVEATLVVGRRGGKSLILALIATFLAAFNDWRPYLSPGERATVVVIAADRKQAQSIFRYIRSMLSIELLAGLVTRETAEEIELSNGAAIEISTASFRTVRGRTVVAALCDELAFWLVDEGASNPDHEIIAALKPAMATIPGAMLLKASSPYARRGVLWDDHHRYFGKPDAPVLVWQADTHTMNPSVPQRFIDEAYDRDPANAAAEYGAQFRTDIESFLSREVVEACVVTGRFEVPPIAGVLYSAFVDPSGGSADAMTIAISHRDGEKVVLDVIREVKPPFSPEQVVADFAALLKSYRIMTVTGDRYGGEWPRERFRVHGIEYSQSIKSKSELYRDLLPALNSHGVELLDRPRLTAQLISLERRTARGGRDSIDHAPGQHDDVANAVAGAVVGNTILQGGPESWLEFYRRKAEELNSVVPDCLVKMVAPAGAECTTYYLRNGQRLELRSDGTAEVPEDDVPTLISLGWKK
jgi:hypothetical protein